MSAVSMASLSAKKENSGRQASEILQKALFIGTEGQKVFMSAGNCLMSIRTHKHYVTVPIPWSHNALKASNVSPPPTLFLFLSLSLGLVDSVRSAFSEMGGIFGKVVKSKT